MHTLYWCKGTASLAPHIVLEEIGLPHEMVEVPTNAGAHREPAYLKINPLGKIPALRLPDGSIMTETAAICLYLADRHQARSLSPAMDAPSRSQFLRHLIYLTNTIQEAYRRYYYPHRLTTDTASSSAIRDQAGHDLLNMFRSVEAHLEAEGPCYLGDQFSLLDIYLTMLVTWFDPVERLLESCPAIKACYENTSARPTVAKCLAMQDGEFSVGTD